MPPLSHSLRSKCIQELQKNTSESSACLYEVYWRLSETRVCVSIVLVLGETLLLWNLLLPVLTAVGLKLSAPCAPPDTRITTCHVLRSVHKPHSPALFSQTALQGAVWVRSFFDHYQPPSTGPGTLCHGNNDLSCQSGGSTQRMERWWRTLWEGGRDLKEWMSVGKLS